MKNVCSIKNVLAKKRLFNTAVFLTERRILMELALLNTSIITTEGNYSLKNITLEQAKKLVQENKKNLDSAIGHQSTAEIMTELLEIKIPVNRQQFVQQKGQKALVFKLDGRPLEGKILTKEEIEKIGFTFQVLVRL